MKTERGFALLAAVFILVVLSALGTFLVRIYTVGSTTSTFAVRGTQAYFAAQSAFNWGAYQALVNASCPASTNVNMSGGALSGFSAVVQCSLVVTTEGNLYTITAVSTKGTLGTIDYVSRTYAGTVVH